MARGLFVALLRQFCYNYFSWVIGSTVNQVCRFAKPKNMGDWLNGRARS